MSHVTITITPKEARGLIKFITDADISVMDKDMNTILLAIEPLSKFVQRMYMVRSARSRVKINLSTAAALFMIFNAYPIESYNHLLDISIKVSELVSIESYRIQKEINILEDKF